MFRADKTPKIPFLGLSLLPNPTETLATQATTAPFQTTFQTEFQAAVLTCEFMARKLTCNSAEVISTFLS